MTKYPNGNMQRRRFLTGVTGGVALLSGCTFGGDDSDSEGSDNGVPPSVPQLDEQRWTKVDESSDKNVEGFGPVDVTAYTRTLYWENEELRERLNSWTLDNFDQTVMMFFASRIEFEGVIKTGVRVSDIEEEAIDEFETQLENHNLRSITTASSTGEMPDLGFRSATHEYRAEYPVPNFSREMDIEGVGNRTIELETDPLSVTGLISIWRDGSATGYVAGGIYPAEPYRTSDTVSLSGGDVGKGIDTSVSVDLRLNPRQYRRELVDLIESVN